MKADEELKELRAHEAKARAAILKLAAEVKPVLAEDLVQYPGREVRKRFVADPEFAASLSDEKVAALKADLAARSAEVRDGIIAAMDDPDLWVEAEGPTGAGKSLGENGRLWAPTRRAADLVAEVMGRHGFPKGEGAPEYRMPTWFIGGRYLPGLAEKYWALVAEVRELRERAAELERTRVRETLGKRWDKL
ncbi:MAG: hypothetical protein FJ087_01890 [Deltaproteobacteria bacterium]|nr:hypothetical protein [Deltaproteobacteria bacterium]